MNIKKTISSIYKLEFVKESAKSRVSFERAETIVSIFYFLQLAFSLLGLIKIGGGDPGRTGFLPIWPVSWSGILPYSEVAKTVFLFYLATAFFAAFFWRRRVGKIVAFLGILQVHAWDSSFGNINHFLYPWLYTSFIFIFLPNTTQSKKLTTEIRQKFMLVFWGAQALFLLTYSLSGIWKFYWGIRQLVEGQMGSFSPYAFSYQVAGKFIRNNKDAFLSRIITENPIPFWPFYLGAIYTEIFALWVAFKPSLHKIWGILLISLHVGNLLFLGIPFFESIVLLSILFLNSPFTKKGTSYKKILGDLPIFGLVFSR